MFGWLFDSPDSIVRSFGALLSLLKSEVLCTNKTSLRLSSYMSSALNEAKSNNIPADIESLGDFKFANSRFIQGDNFLIGELLAIVNRLWLWNGEAPIADSLGEQALINFDNWGGGLDGMSLFEYEFDCVINTGFRDFSGHVYNLETNTGWYSVSNIISHNCRCRPRLIIDL